MRGSVRGEMNNRRKINFSDVHFGYLRLNLYLNYAKISCETSMQSAFQLKIYT